MNGVDVHLGRDAGAKSRLNRVLLACGVIYGGFYVVTNDLIAAHFYDGYSRLNQAVSELSATAAPTQSFLRAMLPLYAAFMIAFGVGVWRASPRSRGQRVLGALLAGFGLTSVMWLPFPMSSRSEMVAGTTPGNDVGHLVLSGVTVLLIVASVAVGARLRRGWFQVYSVLTILVVLGAGGATSALSPKIPQGESTPQLGLYERASIGAWLLWLAVLAVVLLQSASAGKGARQR